MGKSIFCNPDPSNSANIGNLIIGEVRPQYRALQNPLTLTLDAIISNQGRLLTDGLLQPELC